jgi:hypothetical protein
MSKSSKLERILVAGRISSAEEQRKREEYTNRLFELINAWDRDYETEIKQLNGPTEPDRFYWHLYYKGIRINGGLVEDRIEEAEHRAESYRLSYTRDVVLAAHFWDHETATWIPKSELNIG